MKGHKNRRRESLSGVTTGLRAGEARESRRRAFAVRMLCFAGAVCGLVLAALGATTAATASTVSSAAFTGGTGTVSVAGTLYARQGGALTLTVNTSSDTKCVDVSGAFTGHQTSSAAKSSWTFSGFTAPAGNGTQTVTASASPNFNTNGNCTGTSQSPKSASYTLDNTGPSLLPSDANKTGVSPAPNAAGWNNSNVSIAWSASDAGSGVGSGPTPATDSQAANTAGVTKTSTASDRLGNAGSGSVTIKLDKMPPSVSVASRIPAPNGSGWNKSAVTLSLACSDALSGIKSCTGGGTYVFSNEGANQSASATAVDNADNQASLTVNNVNIDQTAPSLSGVPTTSPNGNSWYKGDVTVHWTCSDALSGITAGSCPADSTITGEGASLYDTQSVSDNAGNQTTADSMHVAIDRHAPVTAASAPPAWNNSDVTIDLNATDGLSGVDATYYTVNAGATQTYSAISKPTFSAEGTYQLSYWSVDQAGNEEQHHSFMIGIDKTPPTISSDQSPEPNSNGWNNSDVTVTFTCDDALSRIASCGPTPQSVTSEGANQDVSAAAVDNASNSTTGHASVSLDKTPPTIQASVDRLANANGWYNDDVIVSFTCADQALFSGVDTCPSPVTVGEGSSQSVSRSVADNAGNTASDGVTDLNIDKTKPVLSGAATDSPNGNGWYNGDVTIDWTCSDTLSGIADSCPADSTITGEGGNLSASASVADRADNQANSTVDGIRIDRTAPVTQAHPAAADYGADWYAGSVTVPLDASDALAGVAHTYYQVDGGATQEGTTAQVSGDGAHTLTFWSSDKAGNVEENALGSNSITIQIDTTKPTIHGSASPSANANGWNNGSVVVSFGCADSGSGIASCSDPTTLSNEGSGQSVTGNAEDNVGNTNSDTVSGINIDLTPPSVTGAATGSANANGWYKGDVTIHWSASDTLSGVDTSTLPPDSKINGEGGNLTANSAPVSDNAGNSASGSIGGIKIDRTPPTVSITSPAGTAIVASDTVTVSVSAADSLSGIDSVMTNGAAAADNGDGTFSRTVSLSCGPNTVSASATDKAGNAAQTSNITITRNCLFVGSILAPVTPVSNATASNMDAFKIKSTIPVKFRVYLDQAKTQLMTTPPTGSYAKIDFQKIDNTTDGEAATEVLATSTANTDGMYRWSGSPDYQYIYNLSTTGKAAGTYRVNLTLYNSAATQLAQSAWQYFVLRS